MSKEFKNVKKILFITLSNIGDAILTTPVLSCLLKKFPEAKITVLVGPRAREVFEGAHYIDNVILYDKIEIRKHRFRFIRSIRKEKYDLIVDLRHTLIPLFGKTRYKTPLIRKRIQGIPAVNEHLSVINDIGIFCNEISYCLPIKEEDRSFADEALKKAQGKRIVVSPGAASDLKRWSQARFLEFAKRITSDAEATVIWVGSQKDKDILYNEGIPTGINLMGKTSLMELAAVLEQADIMITNDSGPMHLARAVATPVLSIFGPTDYMKYGPGEHEGCIIHLDYSCIPCKEAHCQIERRECLDDLEVEQVVAAAKELLGAS